MRRLENKVAIITGAGSGIGRATALLFAKEGAKVVLADIDTKEGESTRAAIESEGGSAIFVRTDVSNPKDIDQLVETTINHYSRIDILFNNAGIYAPLTVPETNLETWQRIIEVNLTGVFLCSKAVLPHMIKQGGGIIVNTSSSVGWHDAVTGAAAYCASKGGVTLLTRAMAVDHAKENIRVNCICPGPTETPLLHRALDPDFLRKFAATLPVGRTAKPEEIAAGALFLASDEASFITGIALPIDGGQTAGV